jgi:hydrogenase/urease accessory protein HupE
MNRPLLALSCALLWSLPLVSLAHPLSPPALFVREAAPLHYEVSLRRSELAASRLTIDWPRACQATLRGSRPEGDQRVDQLSLVCTQGLAGQTLRTFGLLELELSMLVHLELRDAEGVRALLTPEHPSLVVPQRESALEVLRDYVGLGIGHLLSGPDHILFVLGLLLLVRGLRARLLALTAFTLGHSVTLCLSALSVIQLPAAPVELGIAASLLVLALEVLAVRSSDAAGPLARRASVMAGSFGLLHGLGFASALADTGLPPHAVPLSLFGFNLGVELGQLLVVTALLPCLWLARGLQTSRRERLRSGAAYGIGALAAMWCLERALILF